MARNRGVSALVAIVALAVCVALQLTVPAHAAETHGKFIAMVGGAIVWLALSLTRDAAAPAQAIALLLLVVLTGVAIAYNNVRAND